MVLRSAGTLLALRWHSSKLVIQGGSGLTKLQARKLQHDWGLFATPRLSRSHAPKLSLVHCVAMPPFKDDQIIVGHRAHLYTHCTR